MDGSASGAAVKQSSSGSGLLLAAALALTGGVAVWGVVDTQGLASTSASLVDRLFESRAWFIMLTASAMLFICVGLAFSRYGGIVLGADDDAPEFSTISWLTMLFAAGMGVGLLYWGTAEPLTHYLALRSANVPEEPATPRSSSPIFTGGSTPGESTR